MKLAFVDIRTEFTLLVWAPLLTTCSGKSFDSVIGTNSGVGSGVFGLEVTDAKLEFLITFDGEFDMDLIMFHFGWKLSMW